MANWETLNCMRHDVTDNKHHLDDMWVLASITQMCQIQCSDQTLQENAFFISDKMLLNCKKMNKSCHKAFIRFICLFIGGKTVCRINFVAYDCAHLVHSQFCIRINTALKVFVLFSHLTVTILYGKHICSMQVHVTMAGTDVQLNSRCYATFLQTNLVLGVKMI